MSSRPALRSLPCPARTERFPEIGHSLAEDKAVVGLETWDLNPPDGTNDEIIRATNPEDAVEKAMAIALGNQPQ